MNSVTEIISLIQARPTVYITRNSISCLKAFLDGWFLRDPENVEDSSVMESFQDWIEEKYKSKSSHSWCDIILSHTTDESRALTKFFDTFEEFKKESNL